MATKIREFSTVLRDVPTMLGPIKCRVSTAEAGRDPGAEHI